MRRVEGEGGVLKSLPLGGGRGQCLDGVMENESQGDAGKQLRAIWAGPQEVLPEQDLSENSSRPRSLEKGPMIAPSQMGPQGGWQR